MSFHALIVTASPVLAVPPYLQTVNYCGTWTEFLGAVADFFGYLGTATMISGPAVWAYFAFFVITTTGCSWEVGTDYLLSDTTAFRGSWAAA